MKNPWAISYHEEALARLDQFMEEADGWMRLYLVRACSKELLEACKRRDPLAVTIALSIDKSLKQLKAGVQPPRKCISCEYVFDGRIVPHAFMVWVPNTHDDEPEHLMTQPVCPDCCASKDDRQLLDHAMAFIRTIFPHTEEVEEDLCQPKTN